MQKIRLTCMLLAGLLLLPQLSQAGSCGGGDKDR